MDNKSLYLQLEQEVTINEAVEQENESLKHENAELRKLHYVKLIDIDSDDGMFLIEFAITQCLIPCTCCLRKLGLALHFRPIHAPIHA